MKKTFLIVLLFTFAVNLTPQSVHQYFYNKSKTDFIEQNRFVNTKIKTFGKKEKLNKTVFGFLPDWEYVSDSKNYLRLDLLTHIAIFGFTLQEDGNLANPLAWPWNDLIEESHNTNVKVIMTVISFDPEITHSVLTNDTLKNVLFENIQTIITNNNLDGVNLDFENVADEDTGSPLNSFVSDLKNYLSPTLEVSFDTPAWNWNGWDFEGLANACDYLFVMEYDYFGDWSENSGPTAPLTGNGLNITRSITEQYNNVPHNKIILGVPYYGIFWTTENSEENSSVTNFLDYLTYRTIKSGYDWNAKHWSNNYSVPWMTWVEDSTKQIWFDNVESIERKYNFAIQQNLKGVGIWALGFDGNRKELWSLINKKFGNSENSLPETPVCFSVEGIKQNGNIYTKINFSHSNNATGYRIYVSNDGISFADSLDVTDTLVFIERNDLSDGVLHSQFYKIAAINSAGISNTTCVLASNTFENNPSNNLKFLIVDGFDRYYGNNNHFNYITQIANIFDELAIAFNSCNNESVIKNLVQPQSNLYWILGNESRATETLNFFEQNYIKEIISNNEDANIFLSGSEIGYDLASENFSTEFDEEFYQNYLKANFIADAPEDNPYFFYTISNVNESNIDFNETFQIDNGSHGTFNVGYPDAIKSNVSTEFNDLIYAGTDNSYAGISYEGNYRLIYFGFPVETIYDYQKRKSVISKAMDFFKYGSNITTNNDLPTKFQLYQNYPNPFNPTTMIEYNIPSVKKLQATSLHVSIKIYDTLGREIATLINKKQLPGNYKINFNAKNLPSGIYFYTLRAGKFFSTKKMILMK